MWESYDSLGGTVGTDADIFLSRSVDAGVTWTAPVPLNVNAGEDSGQDDSPRLTIDGAGNWVAVWYSADTLGGTIDTDLDILVSRSVDAGNTWSAPTPLNTNASTDVGDDYSPQLATDGTGNWFAVWCSDDALGNTVGADFDVFVSRSVDAGITWTDPAPLNANAGEDSGIDYFPQITTDGADRWIAVWSSYDSLGGTIGSDGDILFATFSQTAALTDKVGIHRGHMWCLDADGNQRWNADGDRWSVFGIPGDEPVVGDWDGDGFDEVGVLRGGMWYLDLDGNGRWNVPGDQYFRFGIVGDEPVVGDWDGDGADEVGVHRGSAWYLDTDGSHSWTAGDQYFRFGIPGDDPLVGDWDGDGTDEIGVHRGDTWFLDTDGSHAWNAGDEYFHFGIPGDEPLVGDWNADGTDEVGVHRGDWWYLDTDGSRVWNVPGDDYFRFGIPGDEAVVGRWQSAGGGGSQAGGGQASFASAMPELPAEPETALLVGLLSTSASAAANATQVDNVFAAEPAALSASENDTEPPIDAISGQVTRSSRVGSAGLLDLPATKIHDQVLEELLQSIWWLHSGGRGLA